ncbi:hypothetical protein Hypma_000624 [Hypsizygus marmoreus]|uniref:Uncharacterized protein n=1 Tax=Hypsizygus marmoreus TaxID=39966 RepID=A0A369JHD1_HYPMA|nr:hypothetical protein Hypma_000624 [Hypsizygus marmoreus]
MASSSIFPSTEALTRPFEPIDVDFETSKLIAQLTLDDIAQITGARKGKARADAPLSDEEIAFRIQCEYLESAVRTIDDHRIAKSFNEAIETDHSYLNAISILEQAAADDHQAALALSNGGVLPQPSNAQRLLEDPTFATLLEPVTEPLKTPVEGNTSSTAVGHQPMDESSEQLSPSPNPVHSIKVFKATAIAQPTSSQRPRQSRAQCTSCGDLIRGPRALKGMTPSIRQGVVAKPFPMKLSFVSSPRHFAPPLMSSASSLRFRPPTVSSAQTLHAPSFSALR